MLVDMGHGSFHGGEYNNPVSPDMTPSSVVAGSHHFDETVITFVT